LPWIILKDPDWFYWAFGKNLFRGRLDEEAAEIGRKSCSIKIQKSDPETWRIEYQFTYDDKFSGFSIIDKKSAAHPSEKSKISEYLDLTVPRRMKKYDKFGNQLMLNNFREYYFNGKKLNREKCDRFFIRKQNFLMS
jgi:hypothetical protein